MLQTLFKKILKTLSKKIKAFSLIEISISLIIIGLASLSGLMLFKSFHKRYCIQLTKKRQEMALMAIASFANHYGFLPYPCNPKHSHQGLSLSSDDINEDNWAQVKYIGIIPWRTLNLPQEVIYDGYGNLMTYIMHPLLGKNNKQHRVYSTSGWEYNSSYVNDAHFCQCTFNKPIDKLHTGSDITQEQYDPLIDIIQYHQDLFFIMSTTNSRLYNDKHSFCYKIYFKPVSDSRYPTLNPEKLRYYAKICDCLAVAIISHGTTGGHYNKEGEKTPVNINSIAAQGNAIVSKDFEIFKLNSLQFPIYLNSSHKAFDHIITYSTRFNLQIYGGPRCKPYVCNKNAT